jgi:hypothetical protein
LNITGTIATAGSGTRTLEVDLTGISAFNVNDSFQIFTGVTPGSGTFNNFVLPVGYTWDTTHLVDQGRISVAALPEPGPMMLGMAGLVPAGMMMLWGRKRRVGALRQV